MLPSWINISIPKFENSWHNTEAREFRACLHEGGGPQVGEVTRLAVVEYMQAYNLVVPGWRY